MNLSQPPRVARLSVREELRVSANSTAAPEPVFLQARGGGTDGVIAGHGGQANAYAGGSKAPSALRTPSIGTQSQSERGARRAPLVVPPAYTDVMHLATVGLKPRALTGSGLRDYANAPGLSAEEARDRQVVVGCILASQSRLRSLFTNSITIRGDLILDGCTGLIHLPESLSVGRELGLRDCTGLKRLPQGLRVGGALDLFGCTGLTQLPDSLSVGDSLILIGCTGLTQLPDSLSVGNSLIFFGCTGLTQLPDGLSVGGHLNLYGCTGITSLPTGITTWGLLENHRRRHGHDLIW